VPAAGPAGRSRTARAALVGTGFCGAYTTYSTFGFEAVALAERRAVRMSVAYVAASVLGGLLLAAGGYALTH